MSARLVFIKISETQYLIQDKYNQIIGHLVSDARGKWGFFSDRKNVLLFVVELQEIIKKIEDLTFKT